MSDSYDPPWWAVIGADCPPHWAEIRLTLPDYSRHPRVELLVATTGARQPETRSSVEADVYYDVD